MQGGQLHYIYNWLGERLQKVTAGGALPVGTHVLTAEFAKTGDDEATGSALGTLTLYIDTDEVARVEIMTQPGFFSLCGEGLCVGRDSGSSVSRDYSPPSLSSVARLSAS